MRSKCEAWRRDYNEERLHSAIGNKTPIDVMSRSAAHGPPLVEQAGIPPPRDPKFGLGSHWPRL